MGATQSPVRLLLVDDNSARRRRSAERFHEEPDVDLLSAMGSETGVMESVKKGRPDVVLLELPLTRPDGLGLCGVIKAQFPTVKVLLRSPRMKDFSVRRAAILGIDGYLLDTCSNSDVAKAVREVLAGGAVMDPLITRQMLDEMRQESVLPNVSVTDKKPTAHAPTKGARRNRAQFLSAREMRMLENLTQGWTNKEIANEFGLTEGTIKNALLVLFEKLGVNRRTEAVAWYLSNRRAVC